MINFRYHVVSLTAVFLALAVGLVLGSTVLNGPMLDALESRVNTMGRENSQLREQVAFLEEEVNREQVWADEAAPALLAGTLTGRRVGLLVTPAGRDYAAGVAEKLELAGAIITGTVALTDKFSHPQHRMNELLDVALNSVPESVDADALPSNSDGVETSAALLAAVLMADAPAARRPRRRRRRLGTRRPGPRRRRRRTARRLRPRFRMTNGRRSSRRTPRWSTWSATAGRPRRSWWWWSPGCPTRRATPTSATTRS